MAVALTQIRPLVRQARLVGKAMQFHLSVHLLDYIFHLVGCDWPRCRQTKAARLIRPHYRDTTDSAEPHWEYALIGPMNPVNSGSLPHIPTAITARIGQSMSTGAVRG